MIDIHKINPLINNLLKSKELSTKVQIYMSSQSFDESYDKYEVNKIFTNLNPITIKAYVRDLSSETSFFKLQGRNISNVKEILTESKFEEYFRLCNRIVIDGNDYQVLKDSGSKLMIITRPFQLTRITVERLN